MPTVPRLDRPQVATAPLPTPQTTPMAEGGAVASVGLDVAGRVVGGLARVVERENVRMDEIRASEAELAYRRQLDDVLLNPEKGLLRQRGKRAVEVGTEAQSTFQRILSEAESGLATERQRAMFRARADAMNVTAERQVMAHIGAEMTAVDRQSHEALMIADRESIAALAQSGDMPAVDATVKRMADRLVLFGNRNGWDENALERAEQVEISGARTIQLGAMIDGTMGDPDRLARVRETFRTLSDTLTTQDRETVQKGLAVAELSAQANAIANRLLSGTDDEVERNSIIAGIENPALRDAVRKRVNIEEDAAAKAQKARQARLFANAQRYAANGQDIPPSLVAQLDIADIQAIERFEQAPINDNEAWLKVVRMDAEDIAKMDDREFAIQWSRLNLSHRAQFEKMREEAKGAVSVAGGATRFLSNKEMIERAARVSLGLPRSGSLNKKEDVAAAQAESRLMDLVWSENASRAANGKGAMTPEEMQKFLDRQALTTFRITEQAGPLTQALGKWWIGASGVTRDTEVPAVQLRPGQVPSAITFASIPDTDAYRIDNLLRSAGLTALPESVRNQYIEEIYTVERFEGEVDAMARITAIAARARR
jgi:hypothetical protein